MKKIITTLAWLLAIALPAHTVSAFSVVEDQCRGVGAVNSAVCKQADESANSLAQQVTQVLIYLVGAVSVIMIIVGGLRYATSNGQTQNIEAAKNTVLYAVIGLIIAIVAQAIVLFVANAFK